MVWPILLWDDADGSQDRRTAVRHTIIVFFDAGSGRRRGRAARDGGRCSAGGGSNERVAERVLGTSSWARRAVCEAGFRAAAAERRAVEGRADPGVRLAVLSRR